MSIPTISISVSLRVNLTVRLLHGLSTVYVKFNFFAKYLTTSKTNPPYSFSPLLVNWTVCHGGFCERTRLIQLQSHKERFTHVIRSNRQVNPSKSVHNVRKNRIRQIRAENGNPRSRIYQMRLSSSLNEEIAPRYGRGESPK